MNLLAVIPARGGSKRLPGKNIKALAGKPMIAYSIEAALGCKAISRVVVSTDDLEIKKVAEKFGAEVVLRSAELASDTASSESVLLDVVEQLARSGSHFEKIILLQPTSPLRNSRHVDEFIASAAAASANSSYSVTEPHVHPSKSFSVNAKGWLEPLMGMDRFKKPSSEQEKVVVPNGAMYLTTVAHLRSTGALFSKPALAYRMSRRDSVDIDTIEDFLLCEAILEGTGS